MWTVPFAFLQVILEVSSSIYDATSAIPFFLHIRPHEATHTFAQAYTYVRTGLCGRMRNPARTEESHNLTQVVNSAHPKDKDGTIYFKASATASINFSNSSFSYPMEV